MTGCVAMLLRAEGVICSRGEEDEKMTKQSPVYRYEMEVRSRF